MKNLINKYLQNAFNLKIGLNPVSVLVIFLVTMISIIFSDSLFSNALILLLMLTLLLYLRTPEFIISVLKQFFIFIFISTAFLFIIDTDLIQIFISLLKIIDLLLVTSFFNTIIDYNYLMAYFDCKISNMKLKFISVILRKIFFSIFIAVRTVPELFSKGKYISEYAKLRGVDQSEKWKDRFRMKIILLRSIFISGLIRAKNMEDFYTIKGIDLSKKRTFYLKTKFKNKDIVLILLSFLLFLI